MAIIKDESVRLQCLALPNSLNYKSLAKAYIVLEILINTNLWKEKGEYVITAEEIKKLFDYCPVWWTQRFPDAADLTLEEIDYIAQLFASGAIGFGFSHNNINHYDFVRFRAGYSGELQSKFSYSPL